jgi:transcriptional regulator with XRE-family HTH domain
VGSQHRTNEPFSTVLPRLLKERDMSLRTLAEMLELNPSHLSRGLRQVDYKRLSPQLIRRVGELFELPEGYFPEERELFVIERIRADPGLRDRLYGRWHARSPTNAGAERD